MAIDPSIALGVKPVQIANPLDQYGQFMQTQAIMQQNQLARLMFGEKQREVEDTNKLSGLYKDALGADGNLDRAKLFSGAAAAGLGAKIPVLQKNFADADKAGEEVGKIKAETQAKQIEAVGKKLDIAGQAFGFVRANPTLENAHSVLDYLGANGIYTPEQVAQYKQETAADPTKIAALADQAFRASLDAKDQLAKIQTQNVGGSTLTQTVDPVTGKVTTVNSVKNTVSPDAALSASTSRANNAATVAATVRGQDITDKRERELNGKKPLTEFQGKSAAFADRAQKANSVLSELESKYSPAAINAKNQVQDWPVIGGMLGAATNTALSANDQRAEQAQRDFINAVLRQESGAVIGAGEFDNAKKQYFPQPGDSKAVIQQKAANRKTAIDGLMRNAGPNAGLDQPAQPATSGVKFLGFE